MKEDLRALGDGALTEKMRELQKELTKQNAQIATGTIPKSPGQVRNLKRGIARIKTLLRERSLGILQTKTSAAKVAKRAAPVAEKKEAKEKRDEKQERKRKAGAKG
ncbi:50S ribosomal protein L29 [Candidatus Woesearchaeota archaeon]|nr:50S ribosomal protein L29 [Candidatus Woesearchaeota archaeon]